MIITNIYGGLGNQMFQYALGKSISISQNSKLLLDISMFKQYTLHSFLLNKFNLSCQLAAEEDLKRFNLTNRYKRFLFRHFNYIAFKFDIFFETREFIFDKNVFNTNSKYFAGYWQSFKYFTPIRETLLKEFSLIAPLNDANLLMQYEIKNSNSVSLHIRRGDYVALSKSKKGHALCPISYYKKAIENIAQKIHNPRFFIFSDDIQWVKENLAIKYNAEYIDFNRDYPERDIILMKHCKHNIIANSSFSWWGAWLNENPNKIVIAPKRWMNNLESSDDLIEPNWIKI